MSRAHFRSAARRRLHIVPPKEDKSVTTGCAILHKIMYGAKDAGQCYDAASEAMMKAFGFNIGALSPCIHERPNGGCICFGRGDDYAVLGSRGNQKLFLEESSEHLLMKQLGAPGLDWSQGDIQEIRVLCKREHQVAEHARTSICHQMQMREHCVQREGRCTAV